MDTVEITNNLKAALAKSGYKGEIVKVFSSSFNMDYEVGLVELRNGAKAVIKTKSTYRGSENAEHSRSTEYQNLRMLQQLHEPLIPEPLFYSDETLIMSFMEGTPLAKLSPAEVNVDAYFQLGHVFRKINDIPIVGAEHLPRFDSFLDFFEDKVRHLYQKRLAIDVFPQTFYDELSKELRSKIEPTSDDLGVIWRDANTNNILISDSHLSGLIDFEDMVVGPRFIQLRIGNVGQEKLAAFAQGYGKDMFDRNFNSKHDLIIQTISNLNSVYLANKEGEKEWLQRSMQSLKENLANLEISVKTSL